MSMECKGVVWFGMMRVLVKVRVSGCAPIVAGCQAAGWGACCVHYAHHRMDWA